MTTKTNITLPSLPQPRIMPQSPESKVAYGYSIDDMTTYARAAVEANCEHIADTRKMVPSDIDEIMIRVQEYASAWALVGTTFDDGTLMGQVEQSKTRIREALVEFGSSQPADQDRKDARRYRFWRDEARNTFDGWGVIELIEAGGAQMDAATDAALAAQQSPTKTI